MEEASPTGSNGLARDKLRVIRAPVDSLEGDDQRRHTALSVDETLDTASILDAVSKIHGTCLRPAAWPEALAALQRLLDARVCALVWHDFASRTGGIEQAHGLTREYLRSYNHSWAARNVWTEEGSFYATPGAVWSDEQIVPRRELVHTDFYRNWLAPQNLLPSIRGILVRHNARVWYIVAARSSSDENFGPREVARLRIVLPHLRLAMKLRRKADLMQTATRSVTATLDRVHVAVALIDPQGKVLFANAAAKAIFAARDGLCLDGDAIRAVSAADRPQLQRLIASAFDDVDEDDEADHAFISRPSGLRPLRLAVSPLPDKSGIRTATLWISDPERRPLVNQSALRRLYQLTRAEARLAALIGAGERLEDAAKALGITYETARVHLKRVFSKTQTDRQADLVRLALSMPRPSQRQDSAPQGLSADATRSGDDEAQGRAV